jgi:hypothetical protein
MRSNGLSMVDMLVRLSKLVAIGRGGGGRFGCGGRLEGEE